MTGAVEPVGGVVTGGRLAEGGPAGRRPGARAARRCPRSGSRAPSGVSSRPAPLASGQAVRRLTLDQEIEGSNPSSPANTTTSGRNGLVRPPDPVVRARKRRPAWRHSDDSWSPDSFPVRSPDSGDRSV